MAELQIEYHGKAASIVRHSNGIVVKLAERKWEFDNDLNPTSYTVVKGTPPIEFKKSALPDTFIRQLKTGERVEVTPGNDDQLATFITALDILTDNRANPELRSIAPMLPNAYKTLGFKNKIAYEAPVTINGKPGNVEIQQDGIIKVSGNDHTVTFSPDLKPTKMTNGVHQQEFVFGDIDPVNNSIRTEKFYYGNLTDTYQLPMNGEVMKPFSDALIALKDLATSPRTKATFPPETAASIDNALAMYGAQGRGVA